MQTSPSLFARDDTFFGICEGLGQDFGFNPDLLRVTLAVLLFFSPAVVIGSYFAVGVVMMVARWVFPDRRIAGASGNSVVAPANDSDANGVTAVAA